MISETKGTIMVVDDDHLVLESVLGLLTEMGFQVNGHLCSMEALATFRDHSVDAIFSDINMTGMTGLEFLAGIR